MIDDRLSRRAFVGSATAGVTALGLLGPRAMWAAPAPTSPVVLARCETYDLGDLAKCLALAMDQLGGWIVWSRARSLESRSTWQEAHGSHFVGFPRGAHIRSIPASYTLWRLSSIARERSASGSWKAPNSPALWNEP